MGFSTSLSNEGAVGVMVVIALFRDYVTGKDAHAWHAHGITTSAYRRPCIAGFQGRVLHNSNCWGGIMDFCTRSQNII